MKCALSIALASALCAVVSVRPAFADGANIGLYTDATGNTCSFSGDFAGPVTAYVVFRPDVNGVNGVQFAAPVPVCFGATYLNDVNPPGVVTIGNSQTGISVALPGCYGQPVNVLQINYYRIGGATTPCCEYPIVADPSQSEIIASDCTYQTIPVTSVSSRFNANASCDCVGNSAPSLPSFIEPVDGSTGQSIHQVMTWSAPDWDNNVVEHDVYLGTSSPPPLVVAALTEPTYTPPPLEPLSQYYWRVVVRDAFGLETEGPTWIFATRAANTPPFPPYDPVPVVGAINVSADVLLDWSAADIDLDPLVFDVYFGTSSPPPLVASNVALSWFDPGTLSFESTYYWRIVVRDPMLEEVSGPEWSFTTRPENLPPNPPGLIAPPSPSLNQPTTLTLEWAASDPDADVLRFDVYFGTENPPPLAASNIATTTHPVVGLAFSTQYYWKIVVRDEHDAETSGPVWTFTTRPENYPPNAPSSPSPANGATGRSVGSTTLTWNCTDPDGDAITYDVHFGTANPPPVVATDVAVKSYAPGVLLPSTLYWWRIVAHDARGATTTGPIWSFTTGLGNYPPNVPSNPNPANGATNRPLILTLSWNATDPDGDPMTYDVYFGTDAVPPLVASNVTTKSYGPDTLAFSTTYRWRIVAHDAIAETSGPTWTFTTRANTPPNAPSNPSPAHNAATTTSPTLTWNASDLDGQPLTYNVYFGATNPPPLAQVALTNRSYTPGTLTVGVYYWRVVASDGLASTSGPTWSFTARVPGDVVANGLIDLADAACALQISLWNPGCGGLGEYTIADVDCNGNVTPADARCLHKTFVDGSCVICTGAVATTSVVTSPRMTWPTISIGSLSTSADTLVVTLDVSNVSSLTAFGFYAQTHPKIKLLQARRVGPTNGFVALETHVPSAGTGVVGGYSLGTEPVGASEEFIELLFDVSHGIQGTLLIDGFVDDLFGASQVFTILDGTVGVPPIPSGLVLHQNHPNPFNPQTSISYELPNASERVRVRMWILDISGRVVAKLVDEEQSGGSHEVRWQGKDDRGRAVSSGVYFYVLDVAGERRMKKLVLLK